ncbi:lysosomal acid glucosylceramidase-like [Phymastichus coffea]|uniref:lysosomal acid glucosylceramidase-like n=1 Tax=Phymastichus coffea TaxID=108790 RepID=UPI00273CD6BB|nr:lysosomal acid glucosylceramidase-like [Phymastichus coffea]
MFLLIFLITTIWSIPASAQKCDPLDFGKGSVVCQCNSTYCDYYPDPSPPNKGEFILYTSSKGGKRLERYDGRISNDLGNGYKIKINVKKEYQKIEGFGGAFTDAALINIKSLSSSTQDHLMRSYFTSNGSNYNLGRVPIAGSDFSTRGYTYDDTEGDTALKNFTLAKEDIELKIPLMKEALKLNQELRFLSASWTAPPWMKNRYSYNGFSYLQEKYYQIYAKYIVKFLEEYKKNGLDIWAVSTGNEPFTSLLPISKINSMFWSSGTASKWVINNLGPTLEKSNSNATVILMLDDQRMSLPWYVIDVKTRHSEALKYIKGIAVHWYTDDFIPAKVLSLTHDIVPEKFILMTEACLGDRPWENPKVILGSWSRAERLIAKLFENLNHWVVGWVDWNLALDTNGGPNWVKNYVDAPIIVDAGKDVFYKQPLYYAMIHFSKFIPRNSINVKSESNNRNILSIAFKTNNGHKTVLLYNRSNKKMNVSVIDDEIGNINIELPEYSLHTILY